jgi:hypothetical protein
VDVKYINIDPRELSIVLCREIFSRYACKGKLPKHEENEYGINVKYGREGSKEHGKILFTFATHDDVQVQVAFNVTAYVRNKTYLDNVVKDVREMIDRHRETRSPIIIPGAPSTPQKQIVNAIKDTH